jgi:hypothetical protein
VPLTDVEIGVEWARGDGNVDRYVERFDGVLEGGALDAIALSHRVSTDEDLDRRIRLTIRSARLAD